MTGGAPRQPAAAADRSPWAGSPDRVLDLRDVPVGDYWGRIVGAIRELDAAAGAPGGGWRLDALVGDTPDVAVELPHLLAYLTTGNVRHEAVRKEGAQCLALRSGRVP